MLIDLTKAEATLAGVALRELAQRRHEHAIIAKGRLPEMAKGYLESARDCDALNQRFEDLRRRNLKRLRAQGSGLRAQDLNASQATTADPL